MMTKMKERREAYVEVLEILKHMDKKYVSKIPLDLREFFERNASKEYEFNINNNIHFEEQELKDTTINILAMLNINYWCENEAHKQELLKRYHNNDLKKEEELRSKYSTDNLFKRENKLKSAARKEYINNMPLQHKENKWYKKIYNKILVFIEKIFKANS